MILSSHSGNSLDLQFRTDKSQSHCDVILFVIIKFLHQTSLVNALLQHPWRNKMIAQLISQNMDTTQQFKLPHLFNLDKSRDKKNYPELSLIHQAIWTSISISLNFSHVVNPPHLRLDGTLSLSMVLTNYRFPWTKPWFLSSLPPSLTLSIMMI